ncbi:MAG: 4-hydroxyphenylacetate 3-hydroxylase N-terminal domain-containing protein [Paracoccaceae bacterium]
MKLLCRVSNEYRAAALGSPFDYPLSSRLDENDAILVLDDVFIPWEMFMHGDLEVANQFNTGSGFRTRQPARLTPLRGEDGFHRRPSTRASITGAKGFHRVQAQLGEVIAWRNAFWALSDAMAKSASSGTTWSGPMPISSRRLSGAEPAGDAADQEHHRTDRRLRADLPQLAHGRLQIG